MYRVLANHSPEYLGNNNQSTIQIKCSGCGKDISNAYNNTVYKELTTNTDRPILYFCSTCTDHIKRNGSIFLTTYSFDPNNSNYLKG